MQNQELAQKLADHFYTPHFEARRKNLPLKEFKALPIADRYEDIWVQRNPDSTTMVVEYNDEGPYIRALTYQEVIDAVLKIQEEEKNAAAT
jgi:hypothetical protein